MHLLARGEGSVVALPIVGDFLRQVYNDGTLGISRLDTFARPGLMPRYDCSWVKEDEEQFEIEEKVEDEQFFD